MASPHDLPLFSIITVCRNEAERIAGTCESIVSQTHGDFEWIVIDGASTDGTVEILDRYREKTAVLLSEADGGIYEAMNKGLAHATGLYVVFMNGGDAFASNEVLQSVAQTRGPDLIYGDLVFNRTDGERMTFPNVLDEGYLLKKMVPHQATFYRRALFEQFGTFDTSYRIAADYDLYVRLLEIGKVSYRHIAEPLAVFDCNGISNDPRFRKLRKQENHRVRKTYFPAYRRSLKALRQELRERLGIG